MTRLLEPKGCGKGHAPYASSVAAGIERGGACGFTNGENSDALRNADVPRRRRSLGGSEFDGCRRPETCDQIVVPGRQAPSAQHRMRHDQPIERITGPDQIGRSKKPRGGGRVVEQPAFILSERRYRRGVDADAPGLLEELKLEEGRRRDIQPASIFEKRPGTRMSLFQPDHRIGIEEDHRLRPRNRTPVAVQSHVHLPWATAGSTS